MKVCLINNFPPYSGAGRVTYKLWEALKKNKEIKADLYCTHAMTKDEFKWKQNRGVRFWHSFAYKDHENLSRFFIYFIDRFRIPRGYDVYHICNQMIAFMSGFRRPTVVTLFDVIQLQKDNDKLGGPLISRIYSWLIRRSVKSMTKADAVICISEYSKQEACRLLKLDPQKVTVIYSGINHDVFKVQDKLACRRQLKLPIDKKIILHVGSEIARKNVVRLVEAFAQSKSEAVFVRLGPKSKEVEETIDRLKINQRVIYRESFFEDEVAKYYAAADVLVFPSLEEGFGLPIIEAMACGCPVITSNCGAMKEVAQNSAILVNPTRTDEIRMAIEKVLQSNLGEINVYRQKGIRRARYFNWQKYSHEVVKVYTSVSFLEKKNIRLIVGKNVEKQD